MEDHREPNQEQWIRWCLCTDLTKRCEHQHRIVRTIPWTWGNQLGESIWNEDDSKRIWKEIGMRTEKRLNSTVPFRKFLAWYLKGLGITFGFVGAILMMTLMVLLFVGKAVEQHESKVNLIRSGQYVETDFQDKLKEENK